MPREVAGVLVRRPKTSECVVCSKLPCRADPALLGVWVAVGEGPIAKPTIGTDWGCELALAAPPWFGVNGVGARWNGDPPENKDDIVQIVCQYK